MKKLLSFVCAVLVLLGAGNAMAQKLCFPNTLTLQFNSQSLSGVNCVYTISVSPMITDCSSGTPQMMVPQTQTISMGGTITMNFTAPANKKFVPGKYVIGLTPASGGCSMTADYVQSSTPTTSWGCSCGTNQGLNCHTYLTKQSDYNFTLSYGCTVGP